MFYFFQKFNYESKIVNIGCVWPQDVYRVEGLYLFKMIFHVQMFLIT